jgi:histidine triad (HIT) family protein
LTPARGGAKVRAGGARVADCLFCQIVEKKIPAKIVHEDDRAVAFRDINPQAPLHVLVVPRRHIPSVSAIAEEDTALVGHLHRVAAQLARDEGVADEGYRVVFNTGRAAGQTVFHLHLHVLGGRVLSWPPG